MRFPRPVRRWRSPPQTRILQQGTEGGPVMHGFMFTTAVRDVLSKAREEAARLHNDHVDAEHIALAFTRADTSAARVLRDMNVDPDALRETMQHSVHPSDAPPPRGDLPYSRRAKK